MAAQSKRDKDATPAAPAEDSAGGNLERELDEALAETFPASDPIAVDSARMHAARRRNTARKA